MKATPELQLTARSLPLPFHQNIFFEIREDASIAYNVSGLSAVLVFRVT